MKPLKDWSKEITGLAAMEDAAVLVLYSDMLATAHDIGYAVPDAQLIETEDAAALRGVIPDLHAGIVKAHAEAKTAEKEKKTLVTKPAPVKKTPTKPTKKVVQKESKETTMAKTATAKKTAKKAPAAKKAAKAGKKTAKKAAAKANARTAVGVRNPFGENAVIKVLNKDTGIRADSERGKRVAVVLKYNGKKVADFYAKEQAPNNRTDTLRFLVDKGFISVK
jgi:outer membrane biosynthesis protein TonB